ncbi:hypothetical protein K440DRAFT_642564 [Wilcoxina mikolae CBS 423.85]|nr:hypothetical protein K440DRAFT_642564 [Wilcoxina mikolae CBS 423.85]
MSDSANSNSQTVATGHGQSGGDLRSYLITNLKAETKIGCPSQQDVKSNTGELPQPTTTEKGNADDTEADEDLTIVEVVLDEDIVHGRSTSSMAEERLRSGDIKPDSFEDRIRKFGRGTRSKRSTGSPGVGGLFSNQWD